MSMEIMYNELKHYGEIIADKNHETTEGHFIRFTTYLFEDRYYVVTMFDGVVLMIAEKEDIKQEAKEPATLMEATIALKQISKNIDKLLKENN